MLVRWDGNDEHNGSWFSGEVTKVQRMSSTLVVYFNIVTSLQPEGYTETFTKREACADQVLTTAAPLDVSYFWSWWWSWRDCSVRRT